MSVPCKQAPPVSMPPVTMPEDHAFLNVWSNFLNVWSKYDANTVTTHSGPSKINILKGFYLEILTENFSQIKTKIIYCIKIHHFTFQNVFEFKTSKNIGDE